MVRREIGFSSPRIGDNSVVDNLRAGWNDVWGSEMGDLVGGMIVLELSMEIFLNEFNYDWNMYII